MNIIFLIVYNFLIIKFIYIYVILLFLSVCLLFLFVSNFICIHIFDYFIFLQTNRLEFMI